MTVARTSLSPMIFARDPRAGPIARAAVPERSSMSMNRSLFSGLVLGLLALTSFTKSLIRIRVSLRLLKIVTINNRSTPSPSRYQTKLPLCWGSFLSDDFGIAVNSSLVWGYPWNVLFDSCVPVRYLACVYRMLISTNLQRRRLFRNTLGQAGGQPLTRVARVGRPP